MSRLLQPVAQRLLSTQTLASKRAFHSNIRPSLPQRNLLKPVLWGSILAVAAALSLNETVHLDASVSEKGDVTVDPATSIAFPNVLKVQSKSPLPDFTLVGLGVRTVSFLGIKVYSVAFYADLQNPNLKIPKSATPDEKIEHIVRNTTCALRIVPTRSTSYSHLRDGFMRALQARMVLSRQRGQLTQEEEAEAQSPLRKLKSMFPNTALPKHTPLELILLAPEPEHPRTLIVRDLGALHNDWVAREFVMAYFEGDGISPPLKKSVTANLEQFGY
ncbi:chalcone-flavanone isomerase-domain-containing protein [Cristinia sonorae]|uniref:Chalcone-flavanone isomerase-domain-containing protein n=1 Tax=Cristinia sonorae TaxID=1940300 RepID=A0A8K0UN75_9AGAR|nr:chalcone-flavanone isomerase-domain-containing protein [Cristinia sonorae]